MVQTILSEQIYFKIFLDFSVVFCSTVVMVDDAALIIVN